MKKKVMLAIVLVLIGCLGTVGTIFAKENENVLQETVHDHASVEGEAASDTAVQPRMVCLECASIMQMSKLCLPDSRTYSGTREHGYGLFWSKTCTVNSYEALAVYYCDMCGNYIPFEDEEQSDGLARHHCLEIHSGCGAGDDGYYVVCPFGG